MNQNHEAKILMVILFVEGFTYELKWGQAWYCKKICASCHWNTVYWNMEFIFPIFFLHNALEATANSFTHHCTLLRIWYYGRMKAKSRPSPKSLYHCLLIYMHLLYMFQPYLGEEIHYFTCRLSQKWTSQKNPRKIKKSNSIFDINFFSRKFNKVCKQSFFLEVLCLNW